ncbi:Serine threonine tyrosine-interacting B [Hyphodiscus hymeniophilus]|uniref:Serine threonine tyrosine-interacting B n=1 Tax=Hyphodiscus hymeniophilus TaxID=353542 RepID=A0A9P7AXC7_9HELO|nr:Serine threonine tyrosine-interacting B [Hyphodiscus hymeniophilus]
MTIEMETEIRALLPARVGTYPSSNHVRMTGVAVASEGSASHTTGVTPAGDYFWRAPSPPHIHIPPTPEDSNILLPHAEILLGDQANQEVLKTITNYYYTPRPTDWRYEWRRQAQQILSFLYLGPSIATKNLDLLRQEGITMLLCVRDSKSAMGNFLSGEKVAQQLGIEAAHVDVANTQHLTHRLRDAVTIINDHLVQQYRQRSTGDPDEKVWGKVLLFCESGNERSACVAAAYLIFMFEVNLVGAIQYVQAHRFCVAFDDGHKNLLRSFEEMVQAEKMTLRARPQAPAQASKAMVKRSRDDMDEGIEMELDQADDEARFDGRRVFAPFRDNSFHNSTAMDRNGYTF